jgi:hypothetical protein
MAWMKWVLIGPRHHLWMYDGSSLAKLLHEAGFADVVIMPPGETNIADPGDLDPCTRAPCTRGCRRSFERTAMAGPDEISLLTTGAYPSAGPGDRFSFARSASTIISISSRKPTVGCQPSFSWALVASPTKTVTSAGRKKRLSCTT